ncbi:hypothetical protein [Actinomadura flavalba]|uniref:hypothetical protein n=1 Tax=Actinomadura flavalba TaxID=1120938 RepID=UPI0009DBB144|nr:hypothetical protein [Actinomadura flavalba]
MTERVTAAHGAARRYETCGHAWIGLLRHVWRTGEAGLADGGAIVEGPPALFEIASLSSRDPLLREHGDGPALDRSAIVPADRHGRDQIRWVTDLLRARPATTSAWTSLTTPGRPGDAYPAVTALSFRLRGYRLCLTAMFRSQDAHRCYLSYIPLRGIQVEVAAELSLPPGPLRVFVDVPYLSAADIDGAAAVLAAQPEPHAA